MTRIPPHTYPTFARELLAAREDLSVADAVGLALRADRRRLGLSQRRYAHRRGWPRSRVARLEAGAGRLKLDDVVTALEGTDHLLAVCARQPSAPASTATPVPADAWPRTELLARVRDGSRRFPAHHECRQITYPPAWWWATEATRAGSVAPHWHAPGPSMWDDVVRRAGGGGHDPPGRDGSGGAPGRG